MADKIHYLSAAGLTKLKEELRELETVRTREVAAKIDIAKDLGDLSENAEYISAKEELAFIRGRIDEIKQILKNVSIIEEGGGTSVVHVGSTVEVSINGKNKLYKIVGSNEADPVQGFISNESPLGSAFLGHAIGDAIQVTTPGGVQTYRILKIT